MHKTDSDTDGMQDIRLDWDWGVERGKRPECYWRCSWIIGYPSS